jgi:hypothetical protein
MGQTPDEITQNLAERWCWEVARRDESRVARRLYRQPLVDGVYRLDEGALLEDFLHFLQAIGVMVWLEEAHGAAIHRQMVPCVQYVLLYSLKTRFGRERIQALPSRLCSDEALMQWVGVNAQQGRQGICRRGATTRQGERLPGPIGPDTLANKIVKWHVRDLEAVCNGSIRALAKAGVLGAKVRGIADGTELETTAHDPGRGQVTRMVRSADTRGRMHAIEVTVDGWNVFRLIDAATKLPLAVNVGQMQAPEARWTRALVTQAGLHLQGDARLHKVVFDTGVVEGPTLGWLDPQEITLVVPAKTNMAVTAEARAQAAADEGHTVGHRVHSVRHGQGNTARTERLETEVVGLPSLTTADQSGTPAPGRPQHRRDFQPNPINAGVVRQWRGQDDGPGGQTVFLTNASVAQPRQPVADDDERRLMENCTFHRI